jgi:hypothetical protein
MIVLLFIRVGIRLWHVQDTGYSKEITGKTDEMTKKEDEVTAGRVDDSREKQPSPDGGLNN